MARFVEFIESKRTEIRKASLYKYDMYTIDMQMRRERNVIMNEIILAIYANYWQCMLSDAVPIRIHSKFIRILVNLLQFSNSTNERNVYIHFEQR